MPDQAGVHVGTPCDRPDARTVEAPLGELVAGGRQDGATGVLAGRPTATPACRDSSADGPVVVGAGVGAGVDGHGAQRTERAQDSG